MSAARVRDGGRTQSGCVKGVISLEPGPELEPKPGPELELVEPETDPDGDDFRALSLSVQGVRVFLSFSSLYDTKYIFVCIIHMSAWQICFSVAFYYCFLSIPFLNHDPIVLFWFVNPLVFPSPQRPQMLFFSFCSFF